MSGTAGSGVGYQDIDRPQGALDGVDKFGGRLRSAQVGADRHGLDPVFGGLGGCLFGGGAVGAVGHGYSGSFGREPAHQRPPDSAAAAGHQRHAPGKPCRVRIPHTVSYLGVLAGHRPS